MIDQNSEQYREKIEKWLGAPDPSLSHNNACEKARAYHRILGDCGNAMLRLEVEIELISLAIWNRYFPESTSRGYLY